MEIHEWWLLDPSERYWLETTNRTDVGVDLNAPTVDERGIENWSYSIIKSVQEGDIVFHYEIPAKAITGWSIARGRWWNDSVHWGSRAVIGNRMGVPAYDRPGTRLGLQGPYALQSPVTLSHIRQKEVAVREVHDTLRGQVTGSLYFPFELSQKRQLRTGQAYLTKFPRALLSVFPDLDVDDQASPSPASTDKSNVGQPYREAHEEVAVAQRMPFDIDPDLVDRGVRGHAITQNALARCLGELGLEPRRPNGTEPFFDIAWVANSVVFVGEIKSLTESNEERQLRLGLGQVLRYRHLMAREHEKVRAVLAVERQPIDGSWAELCDALDVLLLWPGEDMKHRVEKYMTIS
jgi:hypothetical protein